MLARTVMLALFALSLGMLPLGTRADQPPRAIAQATTKQPKAAARQPGTQPAEPAAQLPAGDKNLPTKEQILNSPQWRRAMFEFSEWLTAQPLYDKKQVAQIKQRFNVRVSKMTAEELVYMLADMQEKFQIIETPKAKEARAWMAQYLSVMSDKKRAEVLKDMPNLVTMSADQLSAELAKIQQKRSTLDSEQSAFQRGQAEQVANQLKTDRTAQQNFIHDWNSPPVSYSPYRSNQNVNRRLNDTAVGGGMGFYVSPWGGVGMTFGPSSW